MSSLAERVAERAAGKFQTSDQVAMEAQRLIKVRYAGTPLAVAVAANPKWTTAIMRNLSDRGTTPTAEAVAEYLRQMWEASVRP